MMMYTALIGTKEISTSVTFYMTGSGTLSVEPPISIVLSTGIPVTGTSVSTHAIHTVITSTSADLISMHLIVVDTAGATTMKEAGIMDAAITSAAITSEVV